MKQLIDITPDQARRMLATYKGKHLPDRDKVERFKRMICSGLWNAKRHTRILMIKGELKNGKHRLTAIAESGQTVTIKLQDES